MTTITASTSAPATSAPATSAAAPRSTALHVTLWVVQGLLAAAFLMAGWMKLVTPVDVLANQMPWVTGAMGQFVRVIAALELAGAIGLILPAATRILPRLTPAAALGLALTMLGAGATHVARGETPMIVVNLVLGALAAFVAWGRAVKAPIRSR